MVCALVLVATAPTAVPNTNCSREYGGATYKPLIDRAYALRKWRDSDPVTRSQARRIANHRRCARTDATLRWMKKSSRRHRHRFDDYRAERLRRREERRAERPYDCGSYGRFAVPCYVVACESGFDFRARNASSTAGGAYQVIDSTWRAYGGTSYADSHPAAVAPKSEQHEVAARVLRGQGMGAWECA